MRWEAVCELETGEIQVKTVGPGDRVQGTNSVCCSQFYLKIFFKYIHSVLGSPSPPSGLMILWKDSHNSENLFCFVFTVLADYNERIWIKISNAKKAC